MPSAMSSGILKQYRTRKIIVGMKFCNIFVKLWLLQYLMYINLMVDEKNISINFFFILLIIRQLLLASPSFGHFWVSIRVARKYGLNID